MAIGLLLEMAAGTWPERTAIGPLGSPLAYSELAARAERGALALVASGAATVAFLDLNGPGYPVAMLAAALAGLPFCPLNYRLAPDAIAELLGRLDAPLVIAGDAFRDRVAAGTEVWAAEDWWRSQAGAGGPLPAVEDTAPAVLLFTSGTTSTPKAVVLRHHHLFSYVVETVEFGAADQSEAVLVSVPPYHVAGVGSALSNLYAGRRMVHLGDFDPGRWLDTVRREGITHSMVVPTMLARIVQLLDGREAEVPTLRNLAYGGARISPALLEQALRAFPGVDFVNAYGLTESSSTIALLGPEDHRQALSSPDPDVRRRLGSVGRLVPGVEVQVRDQDDALPPGEVGDIWIRGGQVSGEYLALGSVLDPGGWFPTRDRGFLDADGYLFIEGRSDDTIIRGGENIAPAEIEDILVEHPAVADVGVTGVADPEWGQRILAVVVLRPGAGRVSPEDLRAYVRGRVRGSRTPDVVVFAGELPYTPTGKLLRRELAAFEAGPEG